MKGREYKGYTITQRGDHDGKYHYIEVRDPAGVMLRGWAYHRLNLLERSKKLKAAREYIDTFITD